MNFNFYSPTVADLSEGLVAISIENSECETQNQDHTMTAADDDEAKKDEEPLLPNKMGYEWKEITEEFFEAVKGDKSDECNSNTFANFYLISELY